ncbi:MAG: hypothetical protein KME10_27960 [Plectolyngbya sp. WJT66-NPBG17]|jgi:hypothetical protein|nr:hypothetical protein [Plectolyngbya sp. WJT66-NPBG17]
MSKLEKLIDKYNLENADPAIAVKLLANHGISISVEDFELMQSEAVSRPLTGDEGQKPRIELDLTNYDFETVLGECQQLSMIALKNHLIALNDSQLNSDEYPSSLIKSLNALVSAVDRLNGIKETVSVNAAIKTMRSAGYVIFKSSTEIIEAKSNPETVEALGSSHLLSET